METTPARPAVAPEPAAQLLAPPAVPAQAMPTARRGYKGCAGPQCCQAPAAEEGNDWQKLRSPAAAQGCRDVSRPPAAACAPPASGAQQLPGTAPCTPEAFCEAAGELRHRAAGEAGQAPLAAAPAADALPAAGPSSAACSHLTLRRLQSFVHCVVGSPIIQSALLYLEHEGEHPTALPASRAAAGPAGRAAAANLEWTLAQLLALFLRAGYEHARESALLSMLWVLESAHSAWRSPASICLSTYTKYAGAFCPEVVRRLTADWPATFVKLKHALVEAQMDVLQRTGWRMRLDLAADVLPCYAMLFCPTLLDEPKLKLPQRAGVALPLGPASAEHKEWAATMRHLCAVIRDKCRRLKAHEHAQQACISTRLQTPECEDEDERPTKRQRQRAASTTDYPTLSCCHKAAHAVACSRGSSSRHDAPAASHHFRIQPSPKRCCSP